MYIFQDHGIITISTEEMNMKTIETAVIAHQLFIKNCVPGTFAVITGHTQVCVDNTCFDTYEQAQAAKDAFLKRSPHYAFFTEVCQVI